MGSWITCFGCVYFIYFSIFCRNTSLQCFAWTAVCAETLKKARFRSWPRERYISRITNCRFECGMTFWEAASWIRSYMLKGRHRRSSIKCIALHRRGCSSRVLACMYSTLCLPCSAAAGLRCAQWSYQADDTLHDGGCRAAVIGLDKVKCGTPSFEESTVCFSSALTMMPTQSDICWYNSAAILPGKYRVVAGQRHINLHSWENEADTLT